MEFGEIRKEEKIISAIKVQLYCLDYGDHNVSKFWRYFPKYNFSSGHYTNINKMNIFNENLVPFLVILWKI